MRPRTDGPRRLRTAGVQGCRRPRPTTWRPCQCRPLDAEQLGCGGLEERGIMASSSVISASRSATRWASEKSEALVAAVTGSANASDAVPGRRPRTGRWGFLEPTLELVRGTEGELAHLASALIRAARANAWPRRDPDGLDRAVSALGLAVGSARQDCRQPRSAIKGIGLAAFDHGPGGSDGRLPRPRSRLEQIAGDAGPRTAPSTPLCRPPRSHPARPTGPSSRRAPLGHWVPNRRPTSSNTAATSTSPWVSIPVTVWQLLRWSCDRFLP